MNGRFFMEAMGDIKDDFIMEAADLDEIKRCFSEWDDEEDDVTTEPEKTGHKKIKRIPRIRKLLIAAVISVSLLLTANFVAMALGYDSLAILREFGDRIIEMFEGERISFDNQSILKTDGENYNSINEFYEKTNYDIVYPLKLPDNIQIKQISIRGSYDNKNEYFPEYKRIFFVTSKTDDYAIIINMHPDASKAFISASNVIFEEINSFECYTVDLQPKFQCNFIRNNYVYTIIAPTYDDIVTIVSNMKEYEE